MQRKTTIVFLVLILGTLAWACDDDQMHSGCRITNAQCSCGWGCKSEYRYETNEECKKALKGIQEDICIKQSTCLNNGKCSQISGSPRYKCLCETTGYYGTNCENLCPDPTLGFDPQGCVVI